MMNRLGMSKNRYRREGDQHRDGKRWAEAAQAYRKHLAGQPDDQPIYVQLGHALKESGRLIEAFGAYSAAATIRSDDPDAARFVAEVLERLGHDDVAATERGRSESVSVELEIATARHDTPATRPVTLTGSPTFFSVQDLFGYLKAHPTLSGIQRVQAGIALHAIRRDPKQYRFILNYIDVSSHVPDAGEYWMLRNQDLTRVVQYATGSKVDHETLRAMLMECEVNAVLVRPTKGSTIILLGAFWGAGNSVSSYVPAHQAGVHIGVYIYDIIPVSHPELCDDNLVRDFTMSLCDLCAIVDFAMTISDATGDELRRFVQRHGGREFPIATVRLAHDLIQSAGETPVLPAELDALDGRPFVAYVSTIEARKNHIYVVEAWRKLIADGVDVPDLVFVGRYGWKVEGLFELLRSTRNLGGRIHILHGLSDAQLNAIYSRSQFTVFTSVVEGWGLPVGESLCHGTPCVASDTSSIPEVGGNFVDYVDVLNLRQGIETLRRMIADTDYREARRDNIRANFRATTWADVAADFMAKLRVFETNVAPRPRFAFAEGKFYQATGFTIGADLGDYYKSPARILFPTGSFYPPESFGVWMVGRQGRLKIPTELSSQRDAVVFIRVVPAPWADFCTLSVTGGKGSSALIRLNQGRQVVRVETAVDAEGNIEVSFEVEGSFLVPPGDTRNFVVGITGVGFVESDDIAGRGALAEELLLS